MKLKNIFNPKKTKYFWVYSLCGVIGILLSIMLMPIWKSMPDWAFWKNWGIQLINIIICCSIMVYLFGYLIGRIRKYGNGVVKVLTIIEFCALLLIAVGCVLQQFKVINVGGACSIFGCILWCRGTVEIFRAYYHNSGSKDKYPVWWLFVAIGLVSFGVYLYARPLFTDIYVLWIFVLILLLLSLILFIDGFIAKPIKKK